MPDFDPSSLPAVPYFQLPPAELTLPPRHAPSLGVPQLSLDPTLTPPGVIGGGTSAALMAALGHLTDPPLGPVANPGAPDIFAPIPAPTRPELQLHGLGPLDDAINPWLANPMGVAAEEQRKLNALPPIDAGLAQQQHIIHAPEIHF